MGEVSCIIFHACCMRQLSRHMILYKAVDETLVIFLFTLSKMSYQTYYPAVFYDSSLNIPCHADGAPYYSGVAIPADIQDLPDLFPTYSPPKLRYFPTDSDTSSLPGPSTITDGSSNVPLEVITTKRGKPMIIYEKNLFQERA